MKPDGSKLFIKGTNFGNWLNPEGYMLGFKKTNAAIKDYIDHRNKTGLPMYMGEIGHNTTEWQAQFCRVMMDNNIGYTFWPYKKVDSSCMMAIKRPEQWDSLVVKFAEAQRTTFDDIRAARPNQQAAWQQMVKFVENSRFANCTEQKDYIDSMLLKQK